MSSKPLSDLTVTTEPAGVRQVHLAVDVAEERVEKAMHQVARRIAREGRIPGFRKGKAPYAIVLQRYGEQVIRGEAAEELVDPVYREALEVAELDAYRPGSIKEMELAPLRFVFDVPLAPKVMLGDYRALRIKPPKAKVTKKEVSEALDSLRQEYAILEPAGDRQAREGDMLRAGVRGRSAEGAVLFDDQAAEIVLDPGNDYPALGFYQALLGMKAGEERVFSLEMPGAQGPRTVEFTVSLDELFDRTLPGIDDDLARTVGHFDSLKALEQDIRAKLLEHREKEAREEYLAKIIETLLDKVMIEYPQAALDDEIDGLLSRVEERVQRELHISLEDYMRVTKKSEEDLRADLRPQAEEGLRRALLLVTVAQAEGITADEAEIEQRLDRFSAMWGERAEEMRAQIKESEKGMNMIVNDLLSDKVAERLVAIASGEVEALPEEKEQAEGEGE